MDEEGTLIHGIMFSNIIQLFEDQMKINKSYIIEDPIVQPINKNYPNVNQRIELLLHRGSKISEAQPQLTCHKLKFDFKEFGYLNQIQANDDEHDVIGVLRKVRQATRFQRKDKINFGYKRELILMNTMLQTITINLWDDLALNEGQILEENRIQNTIVVFSNLKMNTYHGCNQLQSTFTTGMIQNPKCSEAEKINLWLETIVGEQSLTALWADKTIKECEEIKLNQLLDKYVSLKQDMYYCFKATICEIENKSKPWYYACTNCLKAIIKTTDGISCANCRNESVKMIQRYRLAIIVKDNDISARLTLFEDVAQDFIGCSVIEYIELLKKEPAETKIPIALENTNNEEYTFLFKLDREIEKKRNRLSIIVEGFQKPLAEIFKTNMATTQESPTNLQHCKRRKKKIHCKPHASTICSPLFFGLNEGAHPLEQPTDEIIDIGENENIAAFTQRRRRIFNQRKKSEMKVVRVKKEKH